MVGAFLYMRGKPKIKADTTFTELETARKQESVPVEEPSTERRRYNSEASEPAPKKESFTEMAEQKPAKKKEPTTSSGPIKYTSARRRK